MHKGRLEQKTALITGAASGLGRAMALLFAQHGARLALCDINYSGVKAVSEECGPDARAYALDVTSETQWNEMVGQIQNDFNGFHILVNNAGIASNGSVEDISYDDWCHVHTVNLDSVFLGCKAVLPVIATTTKSESTMGSIINISSIAGIIAAGNMASYNSSKAAVRHLTKSVALHCARQGYPITCNSIHPVFIDTPILEGFAKSLGDRDTLIKKFGRQIPLGRLGKPEDVAYAALYLASDEAKFVTGSELCVDGGISAQ